MVCLALLCDINIDLYICLNECECFLNLYDYILMFKMFFKKQFLHVMHISIKTKTQRKAGKSY